MFKKKSTIHSLQIPFEFSDLPGLGPLSNSLITQQCINLFHAADIHQLITNPGLNP